MRLVLTVTEQQAPSALFAALIFGLASGVVLGVVFAVSRIARSDDRTAKLAEHQRDPAVRAWLATLPRPHHPRPGRQISHQDFIDWGAGEWGAGR